MRYRSARGARIARTLALAAVVACATLAATATSALAGTGSARFSYTANISPPSALAGQSTTFDVALANTSSPGVVLGSAAFTPPLGFRVTGVSLPTGASGHAYVLFNVVLLDRLGVSAGSTLHVKVKATAPSRCNSPFTHWYTVAATAAPYPVLLRLDATQSSLTTTVTCDTATALKFAGQPNDAVVGSAITGTANDTSGPPVTVDLVDSSGNTVDSSAPVTIAVGTNPSSGNLGGTVTQNAVHGVATFNNLTLDQPGNGYTLTASSSGLTSDTSNSFNENNSATPCASGATCTNTITSGSGSLQVDVGSGSTAATLTESVDVGTPMDGPGSNPDADPGCSTYNPPAASADWYEFVVQPADGRTFDRSKTITWTVKNTTADGFAVCFGAPYEFDAESDSGLAPAGTLPDGTQGFVGLLTECSELTAGSPCWESITTQTDPLTGGPEAVAVVSIPAGNTGDPWMAR